MTSYRPGTKHRARPDGHAKTPEGREHSPDRALEAVFGVRESYLKRGDQKGSRVRWPVKRLGTDGGVQVLEDCPLGFSSTQQLPQ